MTKWPRSRAVAWGVAALLVAVGAALLATAGLVSSATDGPTIQIVGQQIITGHIEETDLEALNIGTSYPDGPLCGFQIDVGYVPTIKIPAYCPGTSPPKECIPDPGHKFTAAGCDVVAGNKVRATGGIGTVGGVTGDVVLATFCWEGESPGTSDLLLTVTKFSNCETSPRALNHTDVDGENVVVTPSPSPSPSPSATLPPTTATATPTPSPSPTRTATPTATATATATPPPATATVIGTATAPPLTATPPPPTAPPLTATPPPATATPPTAVVPVVGSPTPKATPVAPPPTGGGGIGPLSDLPWVPALVAAAILAWVLGAAGLLRAARRRSG